MTSPSLSLIDDELNGNEWDRLLLSLSPDQRETLAQRNFEGVERADLDKEIGRTGTIFFSGFLNKEQEYNPALRGPRAISIYDQMWRGDGQVRALVSMCELPLLMTQYQVNPASDDPLDVQIAQEVHDNLLGGGMARPWREVLQHALSLLRYGFSAFEPVWTLGNDDKVMIKKLAPRLARTIYRVWPNTDDEIARVEQRVFVNDEQGGGSYQFPMIEGKDLLWFTLNREGNDFFGESILRPAYKHWFIKETLYKVDAIGCERQSMGIPVAIEPAKRNITPTERANTGKALASLHAHEKTYLVLPAGYEFSIAGVAGSTKPVLPSLEYHDDLMARSILAQFLNFSKGGSYAMSESLSKLFLMALEAYAELICGVFNKYLIRKLVDYNYNVERYPQLVYTSIDQRSTAELVTAASELFKSGALTKTLNTENAMRKRVGLPDLTDEEAAEYHARAEALAKAAAAQTTVTTGGASPTPPAATSEATDEKTVDTDSQGEEADDGVDDDEDATSDAKKAKLSDAGAVDGFITGPYWRDMTALERTADLTAIDEGIDQGKLDMLAATRPIIEKQVAKMIEVVQRQLTRDKLNVAIIDVPYSKELRSAIESVQGSMFELGRETTRTEARKQRSNMAEPIWMQPLDAIQLFLANRAESLTAVLNTKLKANFALAVSPLAGEGSAAMFNADVISSGVLKLAERDLRQATPTLVIDAVNIGRASEAKALGAKSCQYSALLDSNTCSPCGSIDGETIEIGSARYNEVMPPYSGCDGGDNCRCVLVFDFIE